MAALRVSNSSERRPACQAASVLCLLADPFGVPSACKPKVVSSKALRQASVGTRGQCSFGGWSWCSSACGLAGAVLGRGRGAGCGRSPGAVFGQERGAGCGSPRGRGAGGGSACVGRGRCVVALNSGSRAELGGEGGAGGVSGAGWLAGGARRSVPLSPPVAAQGTSVGPHRRQPVALQTHHLLASRAEHGRCFDRCSAPALLPAPAPSAGAWLRGAQAELSISRFVAFLRSCSFPSRCHTRAH